MTTDTKANVKAGLLALIIGLLLAGGVYGAVAYNGGTDFCEQSWQRMTATQQAGIYHDPSVSAHKAFLDRCRAQGR
jgi:hypothetical protein